MKILAFTDIHGSYSALRRIEQKAKSQNIDAIVCTGDITIFQNGIRFILGRLNKLGKKVIMVHGNHEDEKTFRKYSKFLHNIIYIHERHFTLKDKVFLGYGGGGFSDVDEKLEHIAKSKFKKIINSNRNKKIILLTHAPPYRTKLDRLASGYCGNKTLRHFLEKNRIDLLICGHIHENFGKEGRIKKTRILNPGPFGRFVEV